MSAFGRPMTGRRPRMTRAHDRQKTLPLRYPSGGARRACRSPAPRARSAPPSAATSPSPSPSPPPARARPYSASLQPWYEPTTRPSTGSHAGPQRRQHRADEVTLHLLTHAWVALRPPACCARGPAFAPSRCTRRSPAAPAPPPAPCAGVAARAVPRCTARWPLRASSRSVGVNKTCKR
jgi:hypothetical protein